MSILTHLGESVRTFIHGQFLVLCKLKAALEAIESIPKMNHMICFMKT